jgi:hypothetical protein
MSAYVYGYSNANPEHQFIVEYVNREAAWKFGPQWAAEMHCQLLQHHRVFVDSHLCEFAVEDMGDEQFGIVCATHPKIVANEESSNFQTTVRRELRRN